MASIAAASATVRLVRPATMRLATRSALPLVTATVRMPSRHFTSCRPNLAKKYTKEHEWVDLSADRTSAVIGISEYAAQQLGDVVYVEIPKTSKDFVNKGDNLAIVESVKSASDIYAPVRCRVVAANNLLEEKPAIINQVPEDDSHGGGWIAKVEIDETGAKQVDELMDADAYKAFCSD